MIADQAFYEDDGIEESGGKRELNKMSKKEMIDMIGNINK